MKNCFTHCFKQCGQGAENDAGYNEAAKLASMARDAVEYGVEVSKASLANILNPHGENDVSKSISIEELAKEVEHVPDPEDDED